MGYYSNETYIDELSISGLYSPEVILLDTITICNNTTLSINFTGLEIIPSNQDLNNIDIIKITIDWGDGYKSSISPSLFIKQSTIGTNTTSWQKISHQYNFSSRIDNTEIVIKVYNKLNNCLTIKIPVTIYYQSILENCSLFEIISANITNNNDVSYVINDKKDSQMIIVQSEPGD